MKNLFPVIGILLTSLLSPAVMAVEIAAAPSVADELDIQINFTNTDRTTTVSPTGITFSTGGGMDIVYPSQFWGLTVPLYNQGETALYDVVVTNNRDHGNKKYSLKVYVISNTLNEAAEGGGFNGVGTLIGTPQTFEVPELRPGQSVTLHGSIVIQNDGSLAPGLDLTRVIVSNLKKDGGTDEDPKGFYDVETIAWCPPPVAPVAAN